MKIIHPMKLTGPPFSFPGPPASCRRPGNLCVSLACRPKRSKATDEEVVVAVAALEGDVAAGWCAEDDERVVADVPHEACTEAAGHGLPSLRSEHIDAGRAQNRFVVGVEHCDGLRP